MTSRVEQRALIAFVTTRALVSPHPLASHRTRPLPESAEAVTRQGQGRGMTRTSRQEGRLDWQVALARPYVTNGSPWCILPPSSPARPDV